MRILSISLLSVLCASLLSCDGATTQPEATATESELVVIAPRIVRTASVSDERWNSTDTVFAMLYDSDDVLIPGTAYWALFGNRRITLPAIDANKVVSVYVSGKNASGKIWEGWTDWRPAKSFSEGVGIGSQVLIYPSNSDSLVGTWTFTRSYVGTDNMSYRDLNTLVINIDGTYSILSWTSYSTGTLFFYGYYETGSWYSSQHTLTVTPGTYRECINTTIGCAEESSVYTSGTPTAARRFSWSFSGVDLLLQDLDNAQNFQQWSPSGT